MKYTTAVPGLVAPVRRRGGANCRLTSTKLPTTRQEIDQSHFKNRPPHPADFLFQIICFPGVPRASFVLDFRGFAKYGGFIRAFSFHARDASLLGVCICPRRRAVNERCRSSPFWTARPPIQRRRCPKAPSRWPNTLW